MKWYPKLLEEAGQFYHGGGGGGTRPLPKDGGAEEFRGNSTVRYAPKSEPEIKDGRYCTNVSPPQRGVHSLFLYRVVGRKNLRRLEAPSQNPVL